MAPRGRLVGALASGKEAGMARVKTFTAAGSAAPGGHYSHAAAAGGFVFVSGQGPLDPVTKQIVSADIAEQTRVTLDNVAKVLEAAGTSLQHVVKVGVFLRDMKDFDAFNRVFRDYFKGVQPARTTVEVSRLPQGAGIEVAAVIHRGGAH